MIECLAFVSDAADIRSARPRFELPCNFLWIGFTSDIKTLLRILRRATRHLVLVLSSSSVRLLHLTCDYDYFRRCRRFSIYSFVLGKLSRVSDWLKNLFVFSCSTVTLLKQRTNCLINLIALREREGEIEKKIEKKENERTYTFWYIL